MRRKIDTREEDVENAAAPTPSPTNGGIEDSSSVATDTSGTSLPGDSDYDVI